MPQQSLALWLLLCACTLPASGTRMQKMRLDEVDSDDAKVLLDDVDSAYGGVPAVMPERDDLDDWYREVTAKGLAGSVSMLEEGSRWGLDNLTRIVTKLPNANYATDETKKFRFFAHAPVVVLTDTLAVVCYDATSQSTGWCRALILENGQIIRLGARLGLAYWRPTGSRADGATLWKYDGSTAIVCYNAANAPYVRPRGPGLACKALTVTGDSLAASDPFALSDDTGGYVMLEPLPSGSGAVVCYSKYESSRKQTYCNVLTYNGNFAKGAEVNINNGDTKQFAVLAALNNNFAIVCVDDGRNRDTSKLPEGHARGFCKTLQIAENQIIPHGYLELQDSEVQMDSLIRLEDTKALLCYSVNSNIDWGICAVLSVGKDFSLTKGHEVRPETCFSGKGVATEIQLLQINAHEVFACYVHYSNLKCGQLLIGEGGDITKNVSKVVQDRTGSLSDVKLASFGDDTGKMMMCFARSESRYGDKAGGCTVIDYHTDFSAISGVLQDVPTPATPEPSS